MISTGPQTKNDAPIATAGRKMRQMIKQSLASTSRRVRKLVNHHQTDPHTTISTPFVATVLPLPELKDAPKTTRSGQLVHDVLLPSETNGRTLHCRTTEVAVPSGSSGSSSSSNGLTDSESVSAPSSPNEEYQEPPSLPKRHCDKCRSALGENETCECVPAIAVVPPSPPPSPLRPLSRQSSDDSREGANSVHTSNVDQIPDEKDLQVEITEVNQGVEPERTGDVGPNVIAPTRDFWAQLQEEGSQWGDPETVATWTVTNEVEIRRAPTPVFNWPEPQEPSGATPAYTPPSAAENEEDSAPLFSSDGQMTLTLRNFLGAGSHGTVVSADWAEGRRQVAVKVSHKLFISEFDCTEPGLRNLKNELDILKALKQSRQYSELGSNFFPELFKSWQDSKNVYFAMDLYPWNLEDLRWTDTNWDATTGDKILWAAEMILGVQAIHRMRILHRDIKPANVFITASKHLIIGDYGLAHAWLDPFYANFPSSSLRARDAPGTMAYLAPEVVNGFYEDQVNVEVRKYANYGFEADVWSLGVTICDSWSQSGGLFWLQEGEKHLDQRSAIPSKILQMDVEPAVKQIVDGHPIWHLITRMLDRNPKTRIGFNEILAHPVFAHLDWNRVASLEYTPMWSFPEVEPSKRLRPVRDEVEFACYYQPPGDFCINETDSERTRAEKLDQQRGQVLRRAAGAARDWVSGQPAWITDEVLGEYEFDWTAPEVIAEDERWLDDD